MENEQRKIRIALPSKGLLYDGSRELLSNVGFSVYTPNPRQYRATIPRLPDVEVIFQRPGDIVVSVRDGSVDFGITGRDTFLEKRDSNGNILELHNRLGFGACSLNVIVPETWQEIQCVADLKKKEVELGRNLKVATKFPVLTAQFFEAYTDLRIDIILAEGTLEIAPTVGYADLIVDLVSTGTTLRDNRLKILENGRVLESEACLIANKNRLKTCPQTKAIARQLLETIVAYQRANDNLAIFANVRGETAEKVAALIFQKEVIRGLQGPTISRIITPEGENWFSIHLIVKKAQLHKAVLELREVGGSGVVVSPVRYIFEEEPEELSRMMQALEEGA